MRMNGRNTTSQLIAILVYFGIRLKLIIQVLSIDCESFHMTNILEINATLLESTVAADICSKMNGQLLDFSIFDKIWFSSQIRLFTPTLNPTFNITDQTILTENKNDAQEWSKFSLEKN